MTNRTKDIYTITGDLASIQSSLLGDTSYSEPQFTYTGGKLTRIYFAGGVYKDLTYTGDRLTSVTTTDGDLSITKTLSYDAEGRLTSITES